MPDILPANPPAVRGFVAAVMAAAEINERRLRETPLTPNQRAVLRELIVKFGWTEDRAEAAARTARP
jgi:hypothetical protein